MESRPDVSGHDGPCSRLNDGSLDKIKCSPTVKTSSRNAGLMTPSATDGLEHTAVRERWKFGSLGKLRLHCAPFLEGGGGLHRGGGMERSAEIILHYHSPRLVTMTSRRRPSPDPATQVGTYTDLPGWSRTSKEVDTLRENSGGTDPKDTLEQPLHIDFPLVMRTTAYTAFLRPRQCLGTAARGWREVHRGLVLGTSPHCICRSPQTISPTTPQDIQVILLQAKTVISFIFSTYRLRIDHLLPDLLLYPRQSTYIFSSLLLHRSE